MAEPAPKRRRLTNNDDGDHELPTNDSYITIAIIPFTGLNCRWGEEKGGEERLQDALSSSSDVTFLLANNQHSRFNSREIYLRVLGPHVNGPREYCTLWSGQGFTDLQQNVLGDALKIQSESHTKKDKIRLMRTRIMVSVDQISSPTTFKVEIHILWRSSPVCPEGLSIFQAETLYKYLPPKQPISFRGEQWSPRDFYESVHVPDKTEELSANIKHDLLDCELYPFQRRAVRWLLQREGVVVDTNGRVTKEMGKDQDLPVSFEETRLPNGQACFVSHMLGAATTNVDAYTRRYPNVRGGILAEEMGLGKTVEVIAMMCMHTRDLQENIMHDSQGLRCSEGTLIISPPSILEQWKQEIELHAPSLKVMHYTGIKHYKDDKYVEKQLINDLAEHDVVLCTYNTLASEIHYAGTKPERNLRHQKKHVPRKSPLVRISWWRVCLDEAQMVESGVSNAAQVARLIPRINAWAVSGTPLRKDAKDLFGLLLFLRYEPWCQSLNSWDRLLSYFKDSFRTLMGKIAIRHSKDGVREDLSLPPQSRNIITVPFMPIEEQHYSQLYQEMCDDCEVDGNGAPLTEEWDPSSPALVEKMRTWLVRLRQTCLHPEVGGRNRRALGRNEGPLRTVEEVLEVMIDQNLGNRFGDQRAMLLAKSRRGQIYENAKMTQKALDTWTEAYDASKVIAEELRAGLTVEIAKDEAAKPAREKSEEPDADQEANTKIGAWRSRLRAALEVQHICIFFMGNAYFQLKTNEELTKPDSQEFKEIEQKEEAAYEEAKKIRSELLSEALSRVNNLMRTVRRRSDDKLLTTLPTMKIVVDGGGIENRKIYDKLRGFCRALNGQADQLKVWRTKMTEFLGSALIDEDEGVELKGDEYEASTKHQDEMYVYMEALRALFADRSDAITGQENTLIAHEMKLARAAAKRNEGPAPTLFLSILEDREKTKPHKELGSLRGIITEIRALATSLQWQEGNGHSRASAELAIVYDVLRKAQQMSNEQMKSVTALEQEVGLFRETMNTRLEYYRALQKISDTVAPWEEEKIGEPLDLPGLERFHKEESQRAVKISKLLSQQRYLQHLKTESTSDSNQRMCIICQTEVETGTLTVCGHQFCKECIRAWWSEHRTCPMCKRHLHWPKDFHQISYKPQELVVRGPETSPTIPQDSPGSQFSSESGSSSHNTSIYSEVKPETLTQLKRIDLEGASFGTKVDTMVRHLFWLRQNDPGCKSVIFSQYREFLDVLGRAFKQHKVSFAHFDGKDGLERFKHDASIECFLLHAKAQSTGINLVNASHVFLCEPLINTAIELQAIARVHRIGQQRPTAVWMYLVDGTVEESIYDISLERRLSHLKRKSSSRSGTVTPKEVSENAIDKANSMEMQEANLSKLLTSGKNGGEVVDRQDLWKCLFGKAKKSNNGALALEAGQASSEMGRFLRAEAAEERVVKG